MGTCPLSVIQERSPRYDTNAWREGYDHYLQKYGEWDLVIFAIVVIALMRTHVGGIAALIYAGLARLNARYKLAAP